MGSLLTVFWADLRPAYGEVHVFFYTLETDPIYYFTGLPSDEFGPQNITKYRPLFERNMAKMLQTLLNSPESFAEALRQYVAFAIRRYAPDNP